MKNVQKNYIPKKKTLNPETMWQWNDRNFYFF